MGESTAIRLPPTASLRRFHASLDGQPGSEGRTRRIAGLANAPRGHSGESDAAPDVFKNVLRFIQPHSESTKCFSCTHKYATMPRPRNKLVTTGLKPGTTGQDSLHLHRQNRRTHSERQRVSAAAQDVSVRFEGWRRL